MLRKKNERNGLMKKYVVGIILALMLCVPFTGAYALDLFSDDFDAENWDTTKKSEWAIDIRGSDATEGAATLSGIAEGPANFGNMFQVTGTVVGTKASRNNAIINPANLGTVKKDVLKISYDVQPHTLVSKTMHALEIVASGNTASVIDFYRNGSNYKVRLGTALVEKADFTRKEWYSVNITIDVTKEKELTVEVYPRGEETALVTYNGTLAETLGDVWTTAYKNEGASAIRWRVNATAVSDGANVNVCYDNIRIETVPTASNAEIAGSAAEGEKLTASYDFEATEPAFKIEWYAENGSDDILLGEGSEYTLKRGDAGKQIYVKITPNDRSGLVGAAITSDATATVTAADGIVLSEGINEVSASITLIGNEETELSPSLFLVLYDSTGKLYKVISDKTAEESVLSCSFSEAIPASGSARAFLWDKNLSPICWTE